MLKEAGQYVCVKHKSSAKGSGAVSAKDQGQYEVHGYDAKHLNVRKSSWENQRISAVYLDGSVRTQTGDVWDVIPSSVKGAQWETVDNFNQGAK